jgi:hypothetical protein
VPNAAASAQAASAQAASAQAAQSQAQQNTQIAQQNIQSQLNKNKSLGSSLFSK